jgi:hypothetical protein
MSPQVKTDSGLNGDESACPSLATGQNMISVVHGEVSLNAASFFSQSDSLPAENQLFKLNWVFAKKPL